VLIADEVQTGAGRTGTWLACEQWGVAPDVITMAKSLGGGVPLSAIIGRAEIMDAPGPGGLGSTYAGSPVACAAALAVLEIFEEENLLARSRAVGERLMTGLRSLADRHPTIGEVRGLGAMVAIELFKGGDLDQPDAALTQAIVQEAAKRGLVLLSCGVYGNVIRILVPLVASDAELDEGLEILGACFDALA
jgi:4-aminobutyrate aminotransferase/(S)-3-amino-2-methylpropionate transaminase